MKHLADRRAAVDDVCLGYVDVDGQVQAANRARLAGGHARSERDRAIRVLKVCGVTLRHGLAISVVGSLADGSGLRA